MECSVWHQCSTSPVLREHEVCNAQLRVATAKSSASLGPGPVPWKKCATSPCRSITQRPQDLSIVMRGSQVLQGVAAVICHQAVEIVVAPSFFGREAERAALTAHLMTAPVTILVLLGPRSSGKTALLQEVLYSNSFGTFPPTYINGRSAVLTQAGVLASRLRNYLAGAVQNWSQTMQSYVENRNGRVMTALQQSQTMAEVIEAYGKTLMLYKAGKSPSDSWPIMCVDEANVLTEFQWGSREREEELGALLRFFVKVTKEDNSAHVILATSDYAFVGWLQRQIGADFFKSAVIGNFPGDEARKFFTDVALPRAGRKVNLSEDDWRKVEEVCGGNAGELLQVASYYKGDWDEALLELSADLHAVVLEGLRGGEPWTPEQYSTIVKAILRSDHQAVPITIAEASIGRAPLEALLEANLLSCRPPSSWARDLPRQAHMKGRSAEPVITPPTPGHRYCMANLKEDGELDSARSPAEEET